MRSDPRTLLTLVANAIAWGVLLQWPWPWHQTFVPAVVALAAIHLVYPFVARNASLPLLVALVDGAALYAAWRHETWGELTPIVATVLAGIALVALAYAATVVLLLHRRAIARDLAKRDDAR